MGVLRKLSGAEGTTFSVKLPSDIHQRISSLKSRCKEKGFTVDIGEAALAGIRKLLERAEKELSQMDSNKSPKKTESQAAG